MSMRKNWKKFILAGLAGILGVFGTACASDPQEESAQIMEAESLAETSLEIWTFYDRNVPGYYYMFLWDDIAKEYHVNLDVKNYSSDEMESHLSTALVTGELPDIFLTEGGTYLDDFIQADACAPVDEYLGRVSLAEDYTKPYKDGAHYVIPCMLNDYGVVYYDKELLDEMNLEIPKTWEELENMIAAVHSYNEANETAYVPISFGEKDGVEGELLFDIISVCEEANASDKAPGEEIVISPETFQTTAEKVIRLNELGAFSENYMEMGDEEAVTDFINHNAVMLVNRSALMDHLTWNMRENFYTGVFPGTYDENGKYRMVRLNESTPAGLSINASCTEKELAGAICIEYLKRVNEENLKAGCKSMLTDMNVRAERLTQRRLELNSLIDSAAETVTAPSASLDQDRKNALKALTKDLYGGKSDLDLFLEEAGETLQ